MKEKRGFFIVATLIALLLFLIFMLWRTFYGGEKLSKAENPLSIRENAVATPEPRAPLYVRNRRLAPTYQDNLDIEGNIAPGVDPLAGALDPQAVLDTVEPLLPTLGPSREEEGKEEAEIIENLFPKYYIQALAQIQNAFIANGYMRSDEQVSLDTEKGVFAFLEKSVKVFGDIGGYRSQQERMWAEYSAKVFFPKLWARERDRYRGRKPLSLFPQKSVMEDIAFYREHKKDIIDGFLSALIPQEVFAQSLSAGGNDDFVTLPDCWKAKIPSSREAGDNLKALCCNCGLFCAYGCTFYYDCGKEDESKCNVPLGCLNAVCRGDTNAVFDGPPGYEVPATAGWSQG